jgi:Concanavalin A-like lectin/glucanases superfamily
MYLGNNAALLGCQEYFNRCAAAGSPIGATQTPSSYDNAASFNGTNQFLNCSSNSTLTVTGTSFTYAFWANAVNTSNTQQIVCKTDVPGNAREYQILFTSGQLRFNVFPDGIFANRSEINIAAGPVNSWNFYVCRYDAVAATIGISVNGGAFSSTGSVPAITQTNTNPVQFGANPGSVLFYSGALSSVGFWKKALTASEVTQLWNSGAGRTYASLDSTLRTNLISWWALNQSSVTADSHGTNTLTNNGSVTAPNIGPVVTARSDPRQLIIDFAQGIDRLGLWNSMVCWPLRSSQNAASGTTAFSLGGLGQFNGTLVNAPVWGADGVSGFLQNSSRRIETSVGYNFSTQNSIFACARKTAAGDLRLVGQSNETPLFVGTTEIRYFNGANAGGTATHPGTNVRSTYSHAFGSSTVVGMVNGGAPVTSAYSPNNLAIQFFIGQGGLNGWVGDISFFAYFSQQVATSAHSQLHSLYRQTLGLGLGLP